MYYLITGMGDRFGALLISLLYACASILEPLLALFSVDLERHICTHITTGIKCYLHSLRHVYVPATIYSYSPCLYRLKYLRVYT